MASKQRECEWKSTLKALYDNFSDDGKSLKTCVVCK